MKNNKTERENKSFDAVQIFREIKDKISAETFVMDNDDLKKYLKEKSSAFRTEQKKLSASKQA